MEAYCKSMGGYQTASRDGSISMQYGGMSMKGAKAHPGIRGELAQVLNPILSPEWAAWVAWEVWAAWVALEEWTLP